MSPIRCAKTIIALALVTFTLSTVTSVSAQGQYDRNRWSRNHLTRYAYALGYSRGYDDAAQGNYRNYRQLQRWREGTEGWEDQMGTRNTFRDSFRRGFARGFMDARSRRERRFTQSDIDRLRNESDERGRPNRRP